MKLKPCFGVSERVYVPVLWLLAILLVPGVILVLPGLGKNGTWVRLYTSPPGAQVIVNGVRQGPGGEYYFVPRGRARIEAQRDGFASRQEELMVKGRVFASLIFPRRMTILWKLESVESAEPFLGRGVEDFADWTTAAENRERYALPPVLTRAAMDFAVAAGGDGDAGDDSGRAALALASSALPLARNTENLADVFRGMYVSATEGAPVTLDGLVRLLNGPGGELLAVPGIFEGMARTVGDDELEQLGLEEWAGDNRGFGVYDAGGERKAFDAGGALEEYAESGRRGGFVRVTYGGAGFVRIPPLELFVGDLEVLAEDYMPRSGAEPRRVELEAFTVGTTEVTRKEYERFLRDEPRWRPSAWEALVAEGLADDFYLYDWREAGGRAPAPEKPVVNVSWYAAEAYAQWFTGKYLSGRGMVARLASEYEWEVAARLNGVVGNTGELTAGLKDAGAADWGVLGLVGMAGNVREWTIDGFQIYRNRFPLPGAWLLDDLWLERRVVRGGAHIDGSLSYPAAIRGGLEAAVCSPVLGFRLVVVAT